MKPCSRSCLKSTLMRKVSLKEIRKKWRVSCIISDYIGIPRHSKKWHEHLSMIIAGKYQ